MMDGREGLTMHAARHLAVVLLAALLTVPALASSAEATIRAHRVVGNLDQPVGFTFGPGRTIWYVEKTTGRVGVHDLDTGADTTFFRVTHVRSENERGLLGIALDPRFSSRPYVYLYATRIINGHLRNQILRIKDVNGSGADAKIVFSATASSSPYHNGGRILFGPDGMLYVAVGDAHDAANAQDLSDDRGKILRMTPNGRVPSTNPRNTLVWAYGIRNSFGFAFDPSNGRLWETENGPECNDEINLIREGANYGWGPHETCSGSAPRDTNQDGPNPVLPRYLIRNPVGITGMAFCDGCGLGAASEGTALFGAVNDGDISRVSFDAAGSKIRRVRSVASHPGGTISFEVAPGGKIYFSDFGGIYRLVRR
jgi:glucose/arabinose dehydrogenase